MRKYNRGVFDVSRYIAGNETVPQRGRGYAKYSDGASVVVFPWRGDTTPVGSAGLNTVLGASNGTRTWILNDLSRQNQWLGPSYIKQGINHFGFYQMFYTKYCVTGAKIKIKLNMFPFPLNDSDERVFGRPIVNCPGQGLPVYMSGVNIAGGEEANDLNMNGYFYLRVSYFENQAGDDPAVGSEANRIGHRVSRDDFADGGAATTDVADPVGLMNEQNIWANINEFMSDRTVTYFRDPRSFQYEMGEYGFEDGSIRGARTIKTNLGSRKYITFTHKFSLYKHLQVKKGAIPEEMFTGWFSPVQHRFFVRYGYIAFSTRGIRAPICHYPIPMQFSQQVEIDYAIEMRNPIQRPEFSGSLENLVANIKARELEALYRDQTDQELVNLGKRPRIDLDAVEESDEEEEEEDMAENPIAIQNQTHM